MTDEMNPMAPSTDAPAVDPVTEPAADPMAPAPETPEAPAEGETPAV
ncbi:MAG: hypothetical protein WD605_01900 [Candidatus Paceibacterota bacterium]